MSGITRLGLAVTLTLVVAFAIATASDAAGSLKWFAGAPATCSVSGDTATLDTSDGGFAGAYYSNSKAKWGSLMAMDYSFQYMALRSARRQRLMHRRRFASLEHSDQH